MNYHLLSTKEILNKLNTNIEGLSNNEVNKLLKQNGYNKLEENKKQNKIILFLNQFKNSMIIILLIAGILSGIISYNHNEPLTDMIIIFVVIILNSVLGFIEEIKADEAIKNLKKMSSPYIKVIRQNKIEKIKTENLVIGDIIILEAGDFVPADARIIESASLKIEEAMLTGESEPVSKISEKLIDENIVLADKINMVFSGSSVLYGRGKAVVTATGNDTELGKIAKSITNIKQEVTPLQKKINEVCKILSIAVVIIAIIMFITGLFKGTEIIDLIMLSVALAVAAIPEGLITVITVTLAIGVQKLSKKNSIIRKLSSVETLGCVSVICSDKTGTLTQNKMTVKKIYINNNTYNINEINDIDLNYFNKVCYLCNDTVIENDKLLGEPTETALTTFYLNNKTNIKYKRVDEIPFDSDRKMMSTINKDCNYLMTTKGAVESILSICTKINLNGKISNITEDIKTNILNENKNLSKNAYRVLALAYKETDAINKEENDLIFIGLVAMIDPPREEVKEAVKCCFEAGITPIMITGDNIDTAKAIATQIGIYKETDKAISSLELKNMSDKELEKEILNIKVYARVSPEDKIRIVNTFKKLGKIVAMTGDGVNDAPAIKSANIGIGMGITGTEVSKSVASMVLADDNFATIVTGIKEGRRIYKNIENVTLYLLASNLTEVIVIFLSTLFGANIFFPIQILWINLITDTVPAIALGFEKDEKDSMKQKPRDSKQSFFNKNLVLRIVIPAIIKSILILVLYSLVSILYGHEMACGSAFILLLFMELVFAISCKSREKTIFKMNIFDNKYLLASLGFIGLIQMIIINNSYLKSLLLIPNLNMNIHILITIFLIISLILFEITKIIIYKLKK